MNTLIPYFVPQWISILFLMVIPIPFILLVLFVKKHVNKTEYPLAVPSIVVFFILYLLYIALASNLGLFNQVLFPPKVLLFTTFPFALLLFVVIFNKPCFSWVYPFN
jgi:hypothetical protein